jgi:hypothetical protein
MGSRSRRPAIVETVALDPALEAAGAARPIVPLVDKLLMKTSPDQFFSFFVYG